MCTLSISNGMPPSSSPAPPEAMWSPTTTRDQPQRGGKGHGLVKLSTQVRSTVTQRNNSVQNILVSCCHSLVSHVAVRTHPPTPLHDHRDASRHMQTFKQSAQRGGITGLCKEPTSQPHHVNIQK